MCIVSLIPSVLAVVMDAMQLDPRVISVFVDVSWGVWYSDRAMSSTMADLHGRLANGVFGVGV